MRSTVHIIAFSVLIAIAANAYADTPEEAVAKGLKGETGMTDIAGDGLNVLPVTVQHENGVTTVKGTMRHTYRQLDPTLVDYTLKIKSDGTIDGNLTIKAARNGDGIEKDLHGGVAGKVGDIKAPLLDGARWKAGVKTLMNIITQKVPKS